jgi:hypothetical protein
MYGSVSQVKELSGVKPEFFALEDNEEETAEDKMDMILSGWLSQFNSDINTRMNEGEVPDDDPRKPGLDGIANRLMMKMIGYAIQMRSSPVVQLGDFNIQTLNPSDVTRDLERDLLPYQRTRIGIFDSADIPFREL